MTSIAHLAVRFQIDPIRTHHCVESPVNEPDRALSSHEGIATVHISPKAFVALPAALALAVAGPSPAMAEDHPQGGRTLHLTLSDTMDNNSGSRSKATVQLNDSSMTVKIEGTGFVPGMPHAQHFHGSFEENHDFTCPTSASDKDGDGFVNTEEGVPQYGGIVISLTTKGDTSPESGLAVDRMPVADSDGNVSYSRTIELPEGAGSKIRNLHIVQHGLDANGNDKYDLESLGESTFAASLGVQDIPAEATHPATCGTVHGASAGAEPTGGVETGAGGTEGAEATGAFALGGLALLGAAVAFRQRRRVTDAG